MKSKAGAAIRSAMVDISGVRRLARSVSVTGARAKALPGHSSERSSPRQRRLSTCCSTLPRRPPELGFATAACFGKTCVAQRTGGCTARPMPSTPFPEAIRSLESRSARLDALPAGLAQNIAH
jgi:hypothetical protein